MYAVLKVPKENTVNQGFLVQHVVIQKWQIKTSPDKQKLKESIAIRPALEEMLNEVLQAETKRH